MINFRIACIYSNLYRGVPSQQNNQISRVVRKPDFCICENKGADQLCGNRTTDQRLCFRYMDSTIPLLPNFEAIFCGCTARFVSDLVGNPKDRFSHNEAQMMCTKQRLGSQFYLICLKSLDQADQFSVCH